MTLDQLQHFVTAARLQNLTHAADALYLSRSVISRSIAALEQELGTQLLYRSSRSVSCTKAGELLKLRAEHLLAEVESIQREISALDASGTAILRIACGFPLNQDFLNFTETFRAAHPEIIQTFYHVTPVQAFDDLRNGRCDIAVSFSYAQPDHAVSLRWVTVGRGNFCLLTSIHSSLAKRAFVTIEEAEQCLGYRLFRTGGDRPGIAGETFRWKGTKNDERTLETLFLPVQLNQASAIVPEHVCNVLGDLCTGIPIAGHDTAYDINVCCTRDHPSPGVDVFMSALQRNFGNH